MWIRNGLKTRQERLLRLEKTVRESNFELTEEQILALERFDLLVRQRTQTINSLRGHLAEFGVVAPQGRARIGQLAQVLEDGECALPEAVVELGKLLLGQIDELDEKIEGLDTKLRASAREDDETARLMTIPGIGPITAMALQAFAPPMESFRRGRDFSAWLGLVPRQHTTGGKPKMLVAVALANRTARMVWALSTKKEIYQVRAAA